MKRLLLFFVFTLILMLSVSGFAQQVGDTLHVGWSALDNQHNVVIGRTIVFEPWANEGDGAATLIFTDLSENTESRNVRMNRVTEEEGLLEVEIASGYQLSTGSRGGYATVGSSGNPDAPFVVPVYHDRPQGGTWRGNLVTEWSIFPGLFFYEEIPWTNGIATTQFKVAVGGDNVVHIIGGESWAATDVLRPHIYSRYTYDEVGGTFQITNPGGMPEIVTDQTYTSSGNIAVSPDGQRVAISKPISRELLGRIDETSGSDFIVWLNETGGEDWNFENTINLTEFDGPDPLLLPDTLTADVDTFRTSTGNSLFFDEDNVLHVAYEVMPYYHYEETALIFGQVIYWNEVDNLSIRIADGDFFLNAGVTSYGSMTGMPSLYKDPDSGMLWCLYQQFGEPGDTLADGSAMDAGEGTGSLNADMYITASPPGEFNGKLWYKGVNITNTKGTTGSIPAGDCQSTCDKYATCRQLVVDGLRARGCRLFCQ